MSVRSRGRKKKDRVRVNVEYCKYPVIRAAAKILGWKSIEDSGDGTGYDILWSDSGYGIGRLVKEAKRHQRVNHFPGMVQIYRKGHLARAMTKMQKCSEGYDFFPRTWVLPRDYGDVVKFYNSGHDRKICIVKPCAGSQGKGIYLALNSKQIDPTSDSVVQSYIDRPLLIDGKKFDLRVYALVVSCDPLRIYIYREGLVRLCTENYANPTKGNIENQYIHLTNYAVNKHSDDYVESNSPDDEGSSSKRSLSWLMEWIAAESGDAALPHQVWTGMSDVIVKTLISIQPTLAETYLSCKLDTDDRSPFTCFEVLGFDIILNEDYKPHLLEVNHSPSFKTDTHLDARVKLALIEDAFHLLNVSPDDKYKSNARSSAISQMRLYGSTMGGGRRRASKVSGPAIIESDTSSWIKFLKRERKTMGNFQLIYPTDCYADQPTAHRQRFYDHLLSISKQLFHAGIGVGPLGGTALDTVALDKARYRKAIPSGSRANRQGEELPPPPLQRRPLSAASSQGTTASWRGMASQRSSMDAYTIASRRVFKHSTMAQDGSDAVNAALTPAVMGDAATPTDGEAPPTAVDTDARPAHTPLPMPPTGAPTGRLRARPVTAAARLSGAGAGAGAGAGSSPTEIAAPSDDAPAQADVPAPVETGHHPANDLRASAESDEDASARQESDGGEQGFKNRGGMPSSGSRGRGFDAGGLSHVTFDVHPYDSTSADDFTSSEGPRGYGPHVEEPVIPLYPARLKLESNPENGGRDDNTELQPMLPSAIMPRVQASRGARHTRIAQKLVSKSFDPSGGGGGGGGDNNADNVSWESWQEERWPVTALGQNPGSTAEKTGKTEITGKVKKANEAVKEMVTVVPPPQSVLGLASAYTYVSRSNEAVKRNEAVMVQADGQESKKYRSSTSRDVPLHVESGLSKLREQYKRYKKEYMAYYEEFVGNT